SGGNMMKVTAEGKVGIGTTTPGSELDVNGTLRVNQICDRTGANCKDVSGGWTLNSSDPQLKREVESLKQQIKILQSQLKSLAEQQSEILAEQKTKDTKIAKVK